MILYITLVSIWKFRLNCELRIKTTVSEQLCWHFHKSHFLCYTACPSSTDLSPLPSTMSCHLPDTCTGLDCCVSSSKLGRKFQATLDIDPCSYRIIAGIDSWKFTETHRNLSTGNHKTYHSLKVTGLHTKLISIWELLFWLTWLLICTFQVWLRVYGYWVL